MHLHTNFSGAVTDANASAYGRGGWGVMVRERHARYLADYVATYRKHDSIPVTFVTFGLNFEDAVKRELRLTRTARIRSSGLDSVSGLFYAALEAIQITYCRWSVLATVQRMQHPTKISAPLKIRL